MPDASFVQAKCSECGHELQDPPGIKPDDILECGSCGTKIGRYADVVAALRGAAREAVNKAVYDAFGKKPTWR